MNFPGNVQWNLGIYVEMLVKWLVDNWAALFDFISFVVLWVLLKFVDFLQWIPWWLVLIGIFGLAWGLNRKWVTGLVFAFLLFLIGSFGYWNLMMETLAIVLTAVLIALIIGIPTGVLMALFSRTEVFMKPILDGMQTMPSFVYLIPAMIFFSIGKVPGVMATIIYAVPPVIRLTNLAIRSVSREMVEAANSFGSSSWQLLAKVQLPQALPTIMTGINQTTMMALAMVVIASMVGAGGLGEEVLLSINRIDIAMGFESGISIVILAIIIDRLTQGVAQRFKYPE